jgi:hypothetical protein
VEFTLSEVERALFEILSHVELKSVNGYVAGSPAAPSHSTELRPPGHRRRSRGPKPTSPDPVVKRRPLDSLIATVD